MPYTPCYGCLHEADPLELKVNSGTLMSDVVEAAKYVAALKP